MILSTKTEDIIVHKSLFLRPFCTPRSDNIRNSVKPLSHRRTLHGVLVHQEPLKHIKLRRILADGEACECISYTIVTCTQIHLGTPSSRSPMPTTRPLCTPKCHPIPLPPSDPHRTTVKRAPSIVNTTQPTNPRSTKLCTRQMFNKKAINRGKPNCILKP